MDSLKKEQLLITRRSFVVSTVYGLVAVPFTHGLQNSFISRILKNASNKDLFITSTKDLAGQSYITAVDFNGKSYFEIPVAHRCHATTFDPLDKSRAVVFPKRPGYISYLISLKDGVVLKEIKARKGRFFYGHGAFSKDGKYLVATENDYENKKGVVSLWDGRTLDFLGEMNSFGIGPHELLFSRDGKQVIVANGGLYEHPDVGEGGEKGREKLNVEEMQPSLCYIDFASQKKLAEFKPQSKYMSLRHLSLGDDGTVAIAIQNEAISEFKSPLVAFHSEKDGLREVLAPENIQKKMNNFALSVFMEPTSGITCVTCPKGNLVTFWDGKKAEFISSLNVEDAGGVSFYNDADEKGFLISTGKGKLIKQSLAQVRNPSPEVSLVEATSFDNHICLIS